MQEVSQFLEEIGIQAVLPKASHQVFARSLQLRVSDAFLQDPESFREVIEYLEQQQATIPNNLLNSRMTG